MFLVVHRADHADGRKIVVSDYIHFIFCYFVCMLKRRRLNIQKWTLHIVFGLYWVFAFIFFNMFYGRMEQAPKASLTFTFSFLFLSFVCVDIHNRFITKPNLRYKKYHRIILFSIYLFIAAFWLESVLSFVLNIYFWNFEDGRIMEESSRIRYQIGGVNMVVFGGVAIQFMAETFRLHQQNEVKEKQTVESNLKLKEVELDLLKSQVNPHFLFNSLNCIYGLSLEKSEQTPEVIMQLSEILNYMLYRCDNKVLLSEEVKQIENYTSIQQVRFGSMLNLKYQVQLDQDVVLAPLLLLPLVENAFKHGKTGINHEIKVNIELNENALLCFTVENEVDERRVKDQVNGGIGLVNLRRRLELLYPDAHALHIDQTAQRFCANLNLELNA